MMQTYPRLLSLLLLACTAAARTLAPAPGPAACRGNLDPAWVPVLAGQTCAAACAAKGAPLRTPLSFASATAGPSALCTFDQLVGVETAGVACQAGEATSSTYSCRCLAQDQLPGLALPLPGDTTCDRSCAQAMTGVSGTGVGLRVGSSRRVCMAHEDIGTSNRFLSTLPGSADTALTCEDGDKALSGAAFSCVCQYTTPAVGPLGAVAGDPRVAAQSVATLG